MLRGVDVSNWQGLIDWTAVRDAGESFVLIKCTEGLDYSDPYYLANRAHAVGAGLLVGAYHFPGGAAAGAEARRFLSRSGRQPGQGQMLDFEGPILGSVAPVQWALTWLTTVHGLTRNRPLIYMSESTVTRFDWRPVVRGGFALVVADYDPGNPGAGGWPAWTIHQISQTGHVAGVGGDVDLDVYPGTRAQLAALFADDTPAPKPTPTPPPAPRKAPRMFIVHDPQTNAEFLQTDDGALHYFQHGEDVWAYRNAGVPFLNLSHDFVATLPGVGSYQPKG